MRITDIPPCASGVDIAHIVDIMHPPVSFSGKPLLLRVLRSCQLPFGVLRAHLPADSYTVYYTIINVICKANRILFDKCSNTVENSGRVCYNNRV